MNLFDEMCAAHWAIDPHQLQVMADVVLRQAKDWNGVLRADLPGVRAAASAPAGIAVLPVVGPMFPRAGQLDNVSGGTSLESLRHDLLAADENSDIGHIVLDIDSPGGRVSDVVETADIIRASATPVTAFVRDNAASAAYWLASAADDIVMAPTALVGSIGVVASITRQEGPDEHGRKRYDIVSTGSEWKRPDPNDTEQMASILEPVNAVAEQFIGAVAAGRNTAPDDVRRNFGRGGMVAAERAVAVGMADRIATFAGLIESLQAAAAPPSIAASTATGAHDMDFATLAVDDWAGLTAAHLLEHRPDLLEQPPDKGALDAARSEGLTQGATDERERAEAIRGLALPTQAALAGKLVADGVTREAAAVALLQAAGEAQAKGAAQLGADLADAAPPMGAVPPGEASGVAEGSAEYFAEVDRLTANGTPFLDAVKRVSRPLHLVGESA